MTLDPQLKAYADRLAAKGDPPPHTLSPERARAMRAAHLAAALEAGLVALEPVARIENRTIPGPEGEIPIRISTPHGDGPFPAVVYFHGGGWVIGNLDTHDSHCRSIANGAGCVVVAVAYRLFPPHQVPPGPGGWVPPPLLAAGAAPVP